MNLLLGVLTLIAVVALAGGLTALAIGAVLRDRRGTSGTLSSAALTIQALLEPEKQKVVETMEARDEREDRDESGEG
jgi:hypothetical protein